MSVKRAIIMTAAALSLVVGVGTAGTLTANAATPSCGPDCIDLFSQTFPGSYFNVPDQAHPQVGSAVNLAPGSATNQGEDFTLNDEGTVNDYFQAGIVGAALNARYGNPKGRYGDLEIYEFEYSPFGAPTGLCVGVATTPFYGTQVSLQTCGITGKTLWVPVPVQTSAGSSYMFVNGAETFMFNSPFVLTTMSPGSDLLLWPQTSFFNRTVPSVSYQSWGALAGVLPSTIPVVLNVLPMPSTPG